MNAVQELEARQLLSANFTFKAGTLPSMPIQSFVLSDGNALAQGGVRAIQNFLNNSGSTQFQLYYQATLAAVNDTNGALTALPGLNGQPSTAAPFQITVVASVTEQVIAPTSGQPPGTAYFEVSPIQSQDSFFRMYYNPGVTVNVLAGTGFTDGQLIVAGVPIASTAGRGNFQNDIVTVPLDFDQFNNNDYPGVFSVSGAGTSLVDVKVDPATLDRNFFITPVSSLSFNTTNNAPFFLTDPSHQFTGQGGTVIPNIGPPVLQPPAPVPINGVSGPDFQFSALAVASAGVPNPQIQIVKFVNGQDADTPPGPILMAGGPVTFTYTVTNPGDEPLSNVRVVDNGGTPANPADDFMPMFTGGDTNGNGLLDTGETWTYTATGTAVTGAFQNVATVTGNDVFGTTVTSNNPASYFGQCPVVTGLERFGVHHQPTRIVVSFSGSLNPSQAQNLANYRVANRGPDGKFGTPDDQTIPLRSALYNSASRTVTLTTARPINVHHVYQVTVNNPCPGEPAFVGFLNRKHSLASPFVHAHGAQNPGSSPRPLSRIAGSSSGMARIAGRK